MIHVLAAVICLDGKFLIATRPDGTHLAGKWEFPGGKIEPEETAPEGLKREIQEELGVSVIILDKIFTSVFSYPEKTVSLDFYRALPENMNDFNPIPMDDQELAWVKRSEMKSYDFAEADKDIIEFLVKGI
jgi:8-oxo-dGTP diphosphatase